MAVEDFVATNARNKLILKMDTTIACKNATGMRAFHVLKASLALFNLTKFLIFTLLRRFKTKINFYANTKKLP